ncbi:MAG: hypothetical protein RJB38_2028 [Pseudomonadota bacterium]|jgi:demethylmenaquinone methyltransferase/2-methoxy-6-polyprenyl-1,4-benzoquinol methylase
MISAQKPETIQKMFDRIAKRYDLANSILSLGTHRWWKRKLVKMALSSIPRDAAAVRILDCATGTGDIAELWSQFLARRVSGVQGSEIVATDFSEGMLLEARKRQSSEPHRFPVNTRFEWADVQKLSFQDGAFDRATISFGIRNVANPVQALTELGRVVKPGGEVWVLEFGQPRLFGVSALYRLYSKKILPQVGGWISGQNEAYRYLDESSSLFPCGEAFLDLARASGKFTEVSAIELTAGVAYLYCLKR